MKKVLVIAAHPDDEVLGCGGTMARLAREGNEVYTLILGEGVTSRDERRDRPKRETEIKKLKEQVNSANKILGVKESFVFDLPDNRFDTVALLDIVKIIEKVKEKVNPDIIFTHHHGDLNIDHRIAFKAVITAFRPVKDEQAKELYSFEIPSSTEWNSIDSSDFFRPNYFIDIAETLSLKTKALEEYSLEAKDYPHPRSLRGVDVIAKRWGVQNGLMAAEAFEVIRKVIK
jgi:LmbE family N-acetylglucosaminyl deacetylase